MLSLYFSDIKHYVKSRLDELSNNDDALLVSSDQAVEDLEKEIEAAVLPSVRKIHLDAPNVLLRDGYPLEKYPCYCEDVSDEEEEMVLTVEPQTLIFPPEGGVQNVIVRTESAWEVDVEDGEPERTLQLKYYKYFLVLPQDFLRLVTLQMSDWSRPIQTLVNEDSAEYRKQRNRYLRGTNTKPIGALVHQNGIAMAELYSCTSNVATMMFGQYIPEPYVLTYNGDKYTSICEPLKYPCLNQITAHVLRSIGRVQEAAQYDRMAVQPFYIDPDYARLNPPVGERFNTTQQ
jgi:hypothetical protein